MHDPEPSLTFPLLESIVQAAHQLLTTAQPAQAIPKALATIGLATGLDRLQVFEYHPLPALHAPAATIPLMSLRYEWAAPPLAEIGDSPDCQNVPFARAYGRWYAALSDSTPLELTWHALPQHEQAFLSALDIRSLLMVPIRVGDRFWGFLAGGDRNDSRRWHPSQVAHFGLIAESIGAVITRQSAEQGMAAERNLLRTLIDNLPDCIYVKDTESRFLLNNAAHVWLLGARTTEEVLYKTDFDFFPHELASQYYADEQSIIATGEPLINREEPVIHQATGERVWYSSSKVPLRDSMGKIIGLVGMSRDITAGKKSEEALQLSQARYRAIVEDQTEFICRFQPDGTLTFVNEAYCRYFGQPRQALLNRSFLDFVPAEEWAEIRSYLSTLGPQNPTSTYEHRVVTPEGQLRWQRWTDRAIWDDTGQVIELQSVGVDVTEVREAEARARREAARAEALVRVASILSARLELKSVLHGICEESARALHVPVSTVTLYDEASDMVMLAASHGLPPSYAERYAPLTFAEYEKWVRREGTHFILYDLYEHPTLPNYALYREFQMRSAAGATLVRDGRVIGAITAVTVGKTREFSNEEHALLQGIADQAALAIHNARLHEQIQQYSVQLEQRVASRTNELQMANQQLRNEIRERKRVEEALRASETKLRLILDQMPAIVWTTDTELRLTSGMGGGILPAHNAEVATALGLPPGDLAVPYQTGTLTTERHQRALAGFSSEYDIVLQDRQLHVHLQPLRDSHNAIVGTLGLAFDITARMKAEEEIRRALAKERELSELKSRFVSMTSHQFRTPLSTILSSADLLEFYIEQWPTDRKLEHVQRIQTAVMTMTQMMNDILVIGRAEANKLQFQPMPVDLVQFCQDEIDAARIHARPDHHITFESTEASAVVMADSRLLHQILDNLLSNAIKYSPEGGHIQLALQQQVGQVTISVSDQGIGIPPEDQPHLFDAFHRARNVGDLPGTGLGLPIVKKSVDAYGGTITFVSQPRQGSTFTVVLPAHGVDHP